MSYTEYAMYHMDFGEEEIKNSIADAIKYSVDYICVPYVYTKLGQTLTKDSGVKISNSIDYPLGLSDTKTRNLAITNAIENGTNKISIVIQNNYLNIKKYDKLRYDIKSNLEICQQHNIPLYYYLDYRIFTHQSLIKACNILLECSVNNVYVSTGYLLDNVEDNIIACVLLKEKTGINTIFTSNIWNKRHLDLLKKNNIDNLRFSNIHGLELFNLV